MKNIDYNEITIDDKWKEKNGAYGVVKKCYLDNKTYALKLFYDKSYIRLKRKNIENLHSLNNDELLTPIFWTNNKTAYLTHFFDANELDVSEYLTTKEKIEKLKNAKKVILNMHEAGIIHADLISPNILSSDKICKIIDFDNVSFLDNKVNIRQLNPTSYNFIKNYGLKKEIDIHLFNILTFYIINNSSFDRVFFDINQKNYRYFDNNDAKEICDSIILKSKVPTKDFLIDTLEESKINY